MSLSNFFGWDDTTDITLPMGFVDNRLELFHQSNGSVQRARGDILKAGRHIACDIRISAPSVSAHHATFFFESGSWYIRDENSTNKTRLNGTVIQPGQKYEIHIGDIVSFAEEAYCLFQNYSTSHDYEMYDEGVMGGSYSVCKCCGFKIYTHTIDMIFHGYKSSIVIPPCRTYKYTMCSCGKIAGDGRNGTCIRSEGKPQLCQYCGLPIDDHHTCREAIEFDK